jgi:hypothetical protein
MIAALFMGLSNWFERLERQGRDAYLNESHDIVELEHRIRVLETESFRVL